MILKFNPNGIKEIEKEVTIPRVSKKGEDQQKGQDNKKETTNKKEAHKHADNAKKRDMSKIESNPTNQPKERNSEKATSTKEAGSKTQLKTNTEQREAPDRPKETSSQKPVVKSSVVKKTPDVEGHDQRDTTKTEPRHQDDKRQPGSRHAAEHTRNWKPRFQPRHTSYERNESRRSRERSPSPVYVPRSMMDEFKRFMQNKNRK